MSEHTEYVPKTAKAFQEPELPKWAAEWLIECPICLTLIIVGDNLPDTFSHCGSEFDVEEESYETD